MGNDKEGGKGRRGGEIVNCQIERKGKGKVGVARLRKSEGRMSFGQDG